MSHIAVSLCLMIIVARMIWPGISFDEVSLKLFVIAIVILVFPEVKDIFYKVKRVKKGDLEIELGEQVSKLVQETSNLESSAPYHSEISDKILERISKTSSEPRGILMLISMEIESKIRRLADCSGIENINQTSVMTLLNELTSRGKVAKEMIPIFKQFWSIRNKLAHELHAELSAAKLYAIADLGIRILKLLPEPNER